MKRIRNLVFIAVVASAVYSCNPEPSYLITGEISGADGKLVYLQKRGNGTWIKIDSAEIADDFFQFSGRVAYPSAHYLRVEGKRGYKMFLLENSDVIVTGSADTLYNLKIGGSVSNQEYEIYSTGIEIMYNSISDLFDDQHMAIEAGDSARAEAIGKERVAVQQSIRDLQVEFVKEHPGSYASPIILRALASSLSAEKLREMIQALEPDLLRTEIVKSLMITVETMENLTPGNQAPDFTQADLNGIPVTLSEVEGEGPILLYFWASWCSVCRSLNPSLAELYEKNRSDGLRIIAVSLDSSKEEWTRAIGEDKLDWINISDLNFWNNQVALLYNISEIPSGYLLNSEGQITGSNLDASELIDIFNEITFD